MHRFWMISLMLLIYSSPTHAQSTNGVYTIHQDTLAAGGSRVGSGNPMSAIASIGQPAGGGSSTASIVLRAGYPAMSPTPPSGSRTIAVEGTIDDAQAAVVVNGVVATVMGSAFHAQGVRLIEGSNTIVVQATDRAGHVATHSITVWLDTQPPPRPTVGTHVYVTTDATYVLSGTKTPGTSVWINGLQAVALDPSNAWQKIVSLVEGDNVFVIVTQDGAGNTSTAATSTIILDRLPPVISDITYVDRDGRLLQVDPQANLPKTNFDALTLRGQVDDSLTTVVLHETQASRVGRSFEATVALTSGTNTWSLKATSPTGHVTTQTLRAIRGTIPTLQDAAPAQGSKPYAELPLTIQIDATDPDNDVLEYQVLLDGLILRDWTADATASWIPTLAQIGNRTLERRVRDQFGGAASHTVQIYVVRRPVVPP